MKSEEEKKKYEHAVRLCKEGAFAEAEALLDEMALEHPNSKHVMYYRVICFAGMNRWEEARQKYEELSSFRDESARELKAKLDEKIKPRMKAALKKRKTPEENGAVVESADEFVFPLRTALFAFAVLAIVCGAAAFLMLSRTQARASEPLAFEEIAADENAPDKLLETATYCPSGSEHMYKVAVVMSAPTADVPTEMVELKDNIGALVAPNWDLLRQEIEKALILAGNSSETTLGRPRAELVLNAIIPRTGTPLSGSLAGQNIEQFNPNGDVTLSKVTEACGKSDAEESWTGAGKSAGINGKILWWGRLGLAADDAGVVSHIIIRAYPRANVTRTAQQIP